MNKKTDTCSTIVIHSPCWCWMLACSSPRASLPAAPTDRKNIPMGVRKRVGRKEGCGLTILRCRGAAVAGHDTVRDGCHPRCCYCSRKKIATHKSVKGMSGKGRNLSQDIYCNNWAALKQKPCELRSKLLKVSEFY